ncbi:MAG: hypothetical protein ACK55I_15155, partial [bacterium]
PRSRRRDGRQQRRRASAEHRAHGAGPLDRGEPRSGRRFAPRLCDGGQAAAAGSGGEAAGGRGGGAA